MYLIFFPLHRLRTSRTSGEDAFRSFTEGQELRLASSMKLGLSPLPFCHLSGKRIALLHKNWIAFFAALEAYNADRSRFTGRPKLPKDKDKVKGRNILIYDTQALGKRHFKKTGNRSE